VLTTVPVPAVSDDTTHRFSTYIVCDRDTFPSIASQVKEKDLARCSAGYCEVEAAYRTDDNGIKIVWKMEDGPDLGATTIAVLSPDMSFCGWALPEKDAHGIWHITLHAGPREEPPDIASVSSLVLVIVTSS
jgi:hypothetical protein